MGSIELEDKAQAVDAQKMREKMNDPQARIDHGFTFEELDRIDFFFLEKFGNAKDNAEKMK